MSYIPRQLSHTITQCAQTYPVIAILGQRQSGKTTIAIEEFPNKPYVNFEALDTREHALNDPRDFLAQYPDGAILDEIQNVPDLLSYLQVIVDEKQQPGMFILTGSHQLMLHQAISQTLAGRIALLNLHPFTIDELQAANINLSWSEYTLKGFYPRLYTQQAPRNSWYDSYIQTYIERDVRQLINLKDLTTFRTFFRLLAGRTGQLLNMNSLADDVGITIPTVKSWLSILETSFIIFRLQPYHRNWGKRLTKSPKLYFGDVGMACYLLGIDDENQLQRDPLRGALYENLVVADLMKRMRHHGLDPRMYFYRDSSGHEVDVIFETRGKLIPVEIKSSQTYQANHAKAIGHFQTLEPDFIESGFVVYNGDAKHFSEGPSFVPIGDLEQIIEATGRVDGGK